MLGLVVIKEQEKIFRSFQIEKKDSQDSSRLSGFSAYLALEEKPHFL